MDAYRNFAYGLIAAVPSPPNSGNSLTLNAGQGLRFPATPFNAVIWPVRQIPDPDNAEIVTVQTIAGDTLTLLRAQEGSTPRQVAIGDQIAQTIAAKMIDDITAPAKQGRFLIAVPHAQLPAALALSGLPTGILKSTTGTGAVSTAPQLAKADLPAAVAYLDAAQTFTQAQTFSPQILLIDPSGAANQKTWTIYGINAQIPGTLIVQPLADNGNQLPASFWFTQGGDFRITGDLFEKGRTTQLGHWFDNPYDGSRFFASAGTWTVPSGSILTQQYSLVGKTLRFHVYVMNTSVSAAPNELQMYLPSGMTASATVIVPIVIADNGVWGAGYAAITGGEYVLRFRKDPQGTVPWSVASGTTWVAAYLTIPLL